MTRRAAKAHAKAKRATKTSTRKAKSTTAHAKRAADIHVSGKGSGGHTVNAPKAW